MSMDEEYWDLIFAGLEKLRREHKYVDDCWYSCPKAEDGCCDHTRGEDCDCGADAHNALVDKMLAAVKALQKSFNEAILRGISEREV